MLVSVKTIRTTRPSEIFARAASMVDEATWDTGARPDVFHCLVASTGADLEDRLQHVSGSGWQHQRHQGVYLPLPDTERFLAIVGRGKSSRDALRRLTAYLTEAAGWDDLSVWSQDYSTGPDDVVDLFERAASLAASRNE